MLSEPLLRRWIREVQRGRRSPKQFLESLRRLPYDNIGLAKLDTHRLLRRGLPEVIFGEGKTTQQLRRILKRMAGQGPLILVTRLGAEVFEAIQSACPKLRYDPICRLAFRPKRGKLVLSGRVLVVTAGTADMPIAEEAAKTLELLGSRAVRLLDVGVAGVHRLLDHWQLLQRARVIIVVAGMEGALASVVAGLVRCPVIAVPTSVGYGASFQGIAPLLTMLSSC
ncbi:MAG: nickel pincer cofactor biosynthesis protein LarB, partial [Candidatus Omnitrophica bacterium]|nr:nickel pincer cofactor biosynthesis protein LarB [Candidatus Omnitrophota bacterium]